MDGQLSGEHSDQAGQARALLPEQLPHLTETGDIGMEGAVVGVLRGVGRHRDGQAPLSFPCVRLEVIPFASECQRTNDV